MRIPKVLAIHDISCAGRASLTVILPVLAACGIEAIPLPTAVLSNHLAFLMYPLWISRHICSPLWMRGTGTAFHLMEFTVDIWPVRNRYMW